jgi:hypothetical protein
VVSRYITHISVIKCSYTYTSVFMGITTNHNYINNIMKPMIRATIFDKKGRKVATATNSYTKTHPLQKHYAEACGAL